MSQTTIQVHGPIDVYNPEFSVDAETGYSSVNLKLKNNEDVTRTFMVLLQFQDNRGYSTQIVQTDLLTVMAHEEAIATVDYENEIGIRLLDVFVWTDIVKPEPIAGFKYIGESSKEPFFVIPMSNERSVLLSQLLSACEDIEPDCDYEARVQLNLAYKECTTYREFGIPSENWICTEPNINNYS
jgi:hypothetical protein